jgi:regulator of protease activity HflC (stomatin/prohibitin superfamily)
MRRNTYGLSRFAIGAASIGITIVTGLILLAFFVTTIGAGHAGVVYNRNGGLEDQTLSQGWHWVSPMKRVTEYPIATETVSYADVKVGTSDGKPIFTTFSYNYHIDVQKLPAIFNKFRGQSAKTLEDGFLKQRLTEAAKNVTTKYTVMEVLGEKSQEITLAIQQGFASDVADVGFVIESVTFQPPAPDEQTSAAIQAKVDAQQKLEQEKVELEKSKVIADRQREEAKGRADAALIEAEAEAKSNELRRQAVTQELIQMEIAKKWNGQLPQVQGGATPMLQLPAAQK